MSSGVELRRRPHRLSGGRLGGAVVGHLRAAATDGPRGGGRRLRAQV